MGNLTVMMIIICICIFFSALGISSCAPIFPEEAKSRGFSYFAIGLIFSAHPLCMFIVSTYLGKNMPNKRKEMIIIGISSQIIGFILFALIKYLKTDNTT